MLSASINTIARPSFARSTWIHFGRPPECRGLFTRVSGWKLMAKRWYIIHAYSNFENKVADSIRERRSTDI